MEKAQGMGNPCCSKRETKRQVALLSGTVTILSSIRYDQAVTLSSLIIIGVAIRRARKIWCMVTWSRMIGKRQVYAGLGLRF